MLEKQKNKKAPRKTIIPLLLTLLLLITNELILFVVYSWAWLHKNIIIVRHPSQLISQVPLFGFYAAVLLIMLILLATILRYTFHQSRTSIVLTLLLMPVVVMIAWRNLTRDLDITNYELRSETTIGGVTYYVGTERRQDTNTSSGLYSLSHFVYTCNYGNWCSYITSVGEFSSNTPIDEDSYPPPELHVGGHNRAVYAMKDYDYIIIDELGFEAPLPTPDMMISADNAAQLQPLLSMITNQSYVNWSPEGDYLILDPIYFEPPRAYTIPDLVLAPNFFPTPIRNLPLSEVVFSAKGQHMVGVDEDASLRVWNWTTHEVLFETTIHNVQDAVLNQDGSLLAIIRQQPNVTLYDVATGSEIARFDDSLDTYWMNNAHYSPDGRYVATISQYLLRLWNVETGTPDILNRPSNFAGGCAVDFSPDGTLLAATETETGTVHVFDIASGEQLFAWQTGFEGSVCGLDFSPDGTILASGNIDGRLQLWSLETGIQVADIQAHNQGYLMLSVQFNADATMLVTSSRDYQVTVWGIGD